MREFIGNPPPELSELAASIESFALANMGVHGMRSVQGADEIKALDRLIESGLARRSYEGAGGFMGLARVRREIANYSNTQP